MLYRIRHITKYVYSKPVSHCYNLAQMIPRKTHRQTRNYNKIYIEPLTAAASQREDYFGNLAYNFEIQGQHNRLQITAESEVSTSGQQLSCPIESGLSVADALAQMQSTTNPDTILAREYLLDSPMIKVFDAIREYAQPSFDPNRPMLDAVYDLTKRIFTDFTYSPLSTTLATPLSKVLETKCGVCQDFAQLQIACVRAMGFPARYISGYIETLPAPGQVKLVGSDATHAWLSVYSPVEGWIEFDPTNNSIAGEQHIVTAWGRDYSDVSPLRGVLFGGGSKPVLTVSVDVARLK